MFQPNMHNRLENRKWREADQLVKLGRTRFYGKTTLNEWSEGDPRISSPTHQPMGHAVSLPRRLGIQYKGNCTSTLSSAEAPYGNVHPYGQSSTAARKRPLRRREALQCLTETIILKHKDHFFKSVIWSLTPSTENPECLSVWQNCILTSG